MAERTIRPLWRQLRPHARLPHQQIIGRSVSTEIQQELEQASSIASSTGDISADGFDPVTRAKRRREQLPPSRYQFRPPKYYRGPLHPHQPPPPSDPASREFIPGPFSQPRLEETYHSTIASDLMTLSYTHHPPGYDAPQKSARLRRWEGESPYFKNRPLRGPRGDSVLRLLKKPMTFRNIPRLERVTLHCMVSQAMENSSYLHVAGMALQAITGVKAESHKARHSVNQWGLKAGAYVSLTADLKGEQMYDFVAKCVDVVMPKIKDWRGVKGSSGDSSGNITFGFSPEQVALFPEIEVNYDSYPTRMIPGCHITLHTTARNDRDARMLLNACGIPFYGKNID
ncbi:ribosomal protein L5 domain-containing protein [Elsinoe ampelina]|uniref:Large ribosomal subunit protein uL5m n=1 Tax=Elsinoe ampelina TaxID=302913 RepID=A0A6A6GLU8_9PEZI|nr:ribosomal protein L5 domain-containing protein [Elsinoe ampelina]